MPVMRIGFFTDTYTPQINGVVTSIQLFKQELEAQGHEVYVFAPKPDQPDDTDATIRFHSVPFAFQREMRLASPFSIEALKVLDDIDIDIAHSHDPFSIGLFGLSFANRHKIPYVHTYHTLYPEYVHYVWETRLTKRLAQWLSAEFCDACTSIVAPSSKVERYLRTWGTTVPIDVIATGIDTHAYATTDPARIEAWRHELHIQPGEKTILYLGRLGREKNISILIRALWHARTTEARLLIAGDGPYRADLEALVEELDLKEQVDFLGYVQRDDAVAVYHLADVFAFASTTETQGLVVGEAMASGLPVIGVHDDAITDFVIEGRTGLITENRAEALAEAIDTLLSDDTLRAEFSAAAKARAEHFSIQHQTERLEAHYERALSAPKPKRRMPRLALPKRRR
jgi:glycosyltransferase involved in cell wall biosynthesis